MRSYFGDTTLGGTRRVHFRTERAYQGSALWISLVGVDNWSRSSCGVEFKKGERYLVYAWRRGLLLETTQCLGSRPIALAEDDIRFFDNWKSRRTATHILGRIYADPETSSSTTWEEMQKKLTGTIVTAIGKGGQRYSAVTDDTGYFMINPVQAGEYKVTATHSGYVTSDAEYKVAVASGGCADVYARMRADGRVRQRKGK